MEKDQLTFNDLPTVVGELCDRIASMENLLTEKLSKQYETKEISKKLSRTKDYLHNANNNKNSSRLFRP